MIIFYYFDPCVSASEKQQASKHKNIAPNVHNKNKLKKTNKIKF